MRRAPNERVGNVFLRLEYEKGMTREGIISHIENRVNTGEGIHVEVLELVMDERDEPGEDSPGLLWEDEKPTTKRETP